MEEPQLSTTLEPELLRGVPLHECLRGWGEHWQSSGKGNFELSRPLDHIDDFLSHDWQTTRWLKLMSLLIIYNSRAALIATFITAFLLGLVRVSAPNLLNDQGLVADDGRFWVAVALCYAVHAFFLCFWQSIRRLVFAPRFVFLDKLCIAQNPELAHLKQKGILGLAAFMNHSRRLVASRLRFWASCELCVAVLLLLLCSVHCCGGVEATAATLFPDIGLD